MMAARNPALRRFQYVAVRYPLGILVHTFYVWANTVGADKAGDEMLSRAQGLVENEVPEDEAKRKVLQWILASAHLDSKEAGSIPLATGYDRYIPFVGDFINRRFVEYVYAVTGCDACGPPGVGVRIPKWLRDPKAPDPARDTGPVQRQRAEIMQAHRYWLDYVGDVQALADALGLLTDWSRAESVDLNRALRTHAELGPTIRKAAEWVKTHYRTKIRKVPGEVVYRFGDGWTVQRLTTPKQLKYEGKAMAHCVEAYARGSGSEFYSLRDKTGLPWVTVEYDPMRDHYYQVKGIANERPGPELIGRVACFRREHQAQPRTFGFWSPWRAWLGTGPRRYGRPGLDELVRLLGVHGLEPEHLRDLCR